MLVVVVLPCVPATATTHLSLSTFLASHCGPEWYGMPESRNASTTGLPRDNALPTTTQSRRRRTALAVTFLQANAELRKLRAHRRIHVLVRAGDFVARGLRDAAIPPMNVPQMPRMWTRINSWPEVIGGKNETWKLIERSAYPIMIDTPTTYGRPSARDSTKPATSMVQIEQHEHELQ